MSIQSFLSADATKETHAYDQWMDCVDHLCFEQYAISIYTLEDWPSCDAYEDGSTAEEGLKIAIENSDLPFHKLED